MRTLRGVLAGLFATALIFVGPAALAAQTVILRADAWCPYNCDPASGRPGYIIEIAKAVFEPRGLQVDYALLPWDDALAAVKDGRAHGAVGASAVDGRHLILMKEPLGQDETAIAYPAGVPFAWVGPESLRGKKLGGTQGYEYSGALQDYIAAHAGDKTAIDFISGDNVPSVNIQRLAEKRVDLVLDNAQVLRYTIREKGLGDKIKIAPLRDTEALSIGFTRALPEGQRYADMMDDGIKRLRASGALKAILSRYGVEDWAKD